jgi:hypothetical protein
MAEIITPAAIPPLAPADRPLPEPWLSWPPDSLPVLVGVDSLVGIVNPGIVNAVGTPVGSTVGSTVNGFDPTPRHIKLRENTIARNDRGRRQHQLSLYAIDWGEMGR